MVTNTELYSKLDALSKSHKNTKEDVATLKNDLHSISTSLEEIKAMIKELSNAVLGKNPMEESSDQEVGAQIFIYISILEDSTNYWTRSPTTSTNQHSSKKSLN